jgi:hypothetical protein
MPPEMFLLQEYDTSADGEHATLSLTFSMVFFYGFVLRYRAFSAL